MLHSAIKTVHSENYRNLLTNLQWVFAGFWNWGAKTVKVNESRQAMLPRLLSWWQTEQTKPSQEGHITQITISSQTWLTTSSHAAHQEICTTSTSCLSTQRDTFVQCNELRFSARDTCINRIVLIIANTLTHYHPFSRHLYEISPATCVTNIWNHQEYVFFKVTNLISNLYSLSVREMT